MSDMPKVYVFCNSCAPEWHEIIAVSEDGVKLAWHVCSSHAWAPHDMGIQPDGWNRDRYAKYYPNGFDVEWVEDPLAHQGVAAARAKLEAYTKEEYAAKTAVLRDGETGSK